MAFALIPDHGSSAARSPAVIVVPRRAISYNARGKVRFQSGLAADALAVVAAPFTSSPLYAKVVYFHRGRSTLDADNLSKPVLDALKGVVYTDDSQIVLRVAAKVALEVDTYEIRATAAIMTEYQQLIGLLATEEYVLYIEVGDLDAVRLSVGALHGGPL